MYKTTISIVVKHASELKAKADQESKTVQTYAKNKKLSVIRRSGDWYQICYDKKYAYLPVEDAKEVFNAEEKAILAESRKKEKCESSCISYRQEVDLYKGDHSNI